MPAIEAFGVWEHGNVLGCIFDEERSSHSLPTQKEMELPDHFKHKVFTTWGLRWSSHAVVLDMGDIVTSVTKPV